MIGQPDGVSEAARGAGGLDRGHTRSRRSEPGHDLEQGRLPGPRGPDHGDALSLLDREADARERRRRGRQAGVVPNGDVLERDPHAEPPWPGASASRSASSVQTPSGIA